MISLEILHLNFCEGISVPRMKSNSNSLTWRHVFCTFACACVVCKEWTHLLSCIHLTRTVYVYEGTVFTPRLDFPRIYECKTSLGTITGLHADYHAFLRTLFQILSPSHQSSGHKVKSSDPILSTDCNQVPANTGRWQAGACGTARAIPVLW